jgi:hypothetical protein
MCKNNIELDNLSKENLEEIYNTINEIEKGNFRIVKQEHLISNMTFQNGPVPIGEKYIIEVLYTCQICANRKNDKGVCNFDDKFHEQICVKFQRG